MVHISPDLAEIIGMYVGDGYLRYEGRRKELDISGSYEEKEYYDKHVVPLFNRVFNLQIKARYFPHRKTYGFVVRNISVINTFKELGFPSGAKSTTVFIPSIIINSKDKQVVYRFLRGLFDTDGCLCYDKKHKSIHYYPRIFVSSISKKLIDQVLNILEDNEFNCYVHSTRPKEQNWNPLHRVFLVGRENQSLWMSLIGTKNPSKSSRFEIWKKYGFCPTNTNYNQRLYILQGKIDINSFYDGPVA